MSVTLDVSQLEMSSSTFFRFWKSLLMSETPETSQSATGPYVAMAASAFSVKARTAAFRDALLVKVPGGDAGGVGGVGGVAGGDGDGGGGGGDGGGDGDWNCTTKDSAPERPFAKEKLCSKPGAAHSAPSQPSPYESVMLRVHVAPRATANSTSEVYGALPLSVVPSEQVRLQPTSLGYDPREQVIAEEMVGDAGGDGEDGGDNSGDGSKFGAEVLDNRWTSTSESAALQMVMDFTHASVAWSLTVPERVPTMTVE